MMLQTMIPGLYRAVIIHYLCFSSLCSNVIMLQTAPLGKASGEFGTHLLQIYCINVYMVLHNQTML